MHGVPEITISHGNIVWKNGQINAEAGSGRFIPVAPFCDYVFSAIQLRKMVHFLSSYLIYLIFVLAFTTKKS